MIANCWEIYLRCCCPEPVENTCVLKGGINTELYDIYFQDSITLHITDKID